MKTLSAEAIRWLKLLRDTSKPGNPPPDIAAAFTRTGAAKANGRGGFTITGKGREGLQRMQPKPYSAPKRFI